jgi:hypothetical protein
MKAVCFGRGRFVRRLNRRAGTWWKNECLSLSYHWTLKTVPERKLHSKSVYTHITKCFGLKWKIVLYRAFSAKNSPSVRKTDSWIQSTCKRIIFPALGTGGDWKIIDILRIHFPVHTHSRDWARGAMDRSSYYTLFHPTTSGCSYKLNKKRGDLGNKLGLNRRLRGALFYWLGRGLDQSFESARFQA